MSYGLKNAAEENAESAVQVEKRLLKDRSRNVMKIVL